MKILILGPAYPLRGGIAAFTERLCFALQESGHDVEIISYKVQYPGFLFPGKSQYADGPPPAGLQIRSLLHSFNPLNWWRIGKLIAGEKPDLVILKFWMPFFGLCLGSIARLVKRNGHTRVIALIHNLVPHERRPGDKFLSRYFLQPLDGAVVLSESVKEDCRKAGMQMPVKVSPHPLYDHYGAVLDKYNAREVLGLEKDKNWLLFFGLVREYKGLDWLLEAFAGTDRKKLGLKLLVAGEFYHNKAAYIDQINRLGIGDDVVLHDQYIPDNKVKLYFSAADLVVQPYKHATQSGVSQIAYHFDKPMLVTAVGGLPEIVPDGETGIVTAPNPEAIVKGIEKYFELFREGQMLPAIRLHKQRYSWDKMAESILELV